MMVGIYGLIHYISSDMNKGDEALQVEIEPLYEEKETVPEAKDGNELVAESLMDENSDLENVTEIAEDAGESIEKSAEEENIEPDEAENILQDETEEKVIRDDIPDVLHYIDAWNEYHDATINKSADMHPYNWEYLKKNGQDMSYDDGTWYTRKGIDVSHHQKDIDWNAVKAAGFEFVIIRIGYRSYNDDGVLHWDRNYSDYIKGAREAGLEVGVYVFSQAINTEEALEEAEMVLHSIAGQKLELPVVYDPESIRKPNARTNNISGEQFTQNTIAFCERIKKAGYTPMIYSNMVWEDVFFDMDILDEYEFWYADYEDVPQTPYNFTFWQYACDGDVSGIGPRVDLDIQFMRRTP